MRRAVGIVSLLAALLALSAGWSAGAFARSGHNRRRQGCDRFVRPLRAEVLWIATSWRLLEVGRHHATVQEAHAIFGSIWDEFLK